MYNDISWKSATRSVSGATGRRFVFLPSPSFFKRGTFELNVFSIDRGTIEKSIPILAAHFSNLLESYDARKEKTTIIFGFTSVCTSPSALFMPVTFNMALKIIFIALTINSKGYKNARVKTNCSHYFSMALPVELEL